MNKKMKVSNKSNLELMESVLAKIESYGYHIKDKVFGNCYFIFEDEENSVCHFHIKEFPGFIFGLWSTCRFDKIEDQLKNNGIGNTWADSLNISPLSEIVFFTQYERDLDKFKPSRSGFVVGLYRDVWEEGDDIDHIHQVEDWKNDYILENVLEYIKKHPIRSAQYASAEAKFIWDDTRSGIRIFRDWLHSWYYHCKYKTIRLIKFKWYVFLVKRLVKKLTQYKYVVFDSGDNSTPRIDILVRRKDDIDMKKFSKEQDRLYNFYDKWFNGYLLNDFDIDITRDDITSEDLKNDEKYKKRFAKMIANSIKAIENNDTEWVDTILITNVKELMK